MKARLVAIGAVLLGILLGCSVGMPVAPQPTATPVVTVAPATSLPAQPPAAQDSTPVTPISPTPTQAAGQKSMAASPAKAAIVPAASPREITVPGLGYSVSFSDPFYVTVNGRKRAINPPTYGQPTWVADIGVMPGSSTSDTTYIACHVSSIRPASQFPCNMVNRHMDTGTRIVVTTDAGMVSYAVQYTRTIPYGDLATDEDTWAVVPNRLVWIMCDVADGKPTHMNYVVYAART